MKCQFNLYREYDLNRTHPTGKLESKNITMNKPTNNSDAEIPAEFRLVELSREPIELFKILKFESMVASGGEAKAAIASGQVFLNGEAETQKRKKIVSGDRIEFGDEKICVQISSSTSIKVTPPKVEVKPVPKKKAVSRKAIPAITRGSKKK